MFVHPATHHFSRTYGGHAAQPHQTTGRKNLNKENAAALPSKTPSRMGGKIIPSTSLRTGLGVKTVDRDGNVSRQPDTAKGKGREVDDIEPKRLFASTSGPSKLSTGLPPSKSLTSLPTIPNRTATSTLHRTPATKKILKNATNLRTPAPPPAIPPTPTPLPSATRTRRRSRQSLTPLEAASTRETFQTPAPSGHRWEEEASLGSITEGLEGVDLGTGLDEVVEVDEGDDEIEYMPPPVVELPWEPGFEHPDMKAVFSILSSLPPLWTFDEPKADLDISALSFGNETSGPIRLCDDDDLEEPMFRKDPKLSKPKLQTLSRLNPAVTAKAPIKVGRSFQPGDTTRSISRPPPIKPVTLSRPPIPRPTSRPPTAEVARFRPALVLQRRTEAAKVTPPVQAVPIKVPVFDDLEDGQVGMADMQFDLDYSLDDE